MDVLSLKRHLPSIEDGRWVTSEELPALLDIKIKVRGASSRAARDMYAAKERAVEPRDRDAMGRIKPDALNKILLTMIGEWSLVEVEGLTADGKVLDAKAVAELVMLPEYQPVADLIMQAVAIVDQTREAQVEVVAKN